VGKKSGWVIIVKCREWELVLRSDLLSMSILEKYPINTAFWLEDFWTKCMFHDMMFWQDDDDVCFILRAPDNFQVQRVITPYFWKCCIFTYFLCTVVLSTSEKIAYMYTFKIMFGWFILIIQSDLFWHRCLERQAFGTPRKYTLSPSKSIKGSNYGDFLKDKNALLCTRLYKYTPNLESLLTQQYVCVMCTLWSDNTCVFTRFHGVKTQIRSLSGALILDHSMNLILLFIVLAHWNNSSSTG
jgi:hypothetical protein